MESFARVYNELRDLECERDFWCNRAGGMFCTREIISPLDKHSAVGKAESRKDGDDFAEAPGVDELESESS